jgi:hypothetical protein
MYLYSGVYIVTVKQNFHIVLKLKRFTRWQGFVVSDLVHITVYFN